MESANHEFTWMSGHPQLTSSVAIQKRPPSPSTAVNEIDRVSEVHVTNTFQTTRYPEGSIAINNGYQDVNDVESTSSTAISNTKRPIPLPRVFRRRPSSSSAASTSSSSTDTASSDKPTPNSPGNIKNDENTTNLVDSVNMDSVKLPLLPVSKSVLFEFDPIMQMSTSQLKSDVDSTDKLLIESNQFPRNFSPLMASPSPLSSCRPSPKPRQNNMKDTATSSADSYTKSPVLPPKLSSNSVKFGLSTVPPPPPQGSELPVPAPVQKETKEPTGPSPKISPIHIDNPCYMLVMPIRNYNTRTSDEEEQLSVSGSHSDSDEVDKPCFDAPNILPHHQQQQQPPLLNACHSASSKIPIYQNLLELCGSREGVYAQIRKPTQVVVGLNQIVQTGPPPLPPRGQQRSSIEPNESTNVNVSSIDRNLWVRNERLSEVIRNIPHRGHLFRIGRGRKEIIQKWAVLERGHLQLFSDDMCENPQDIFHQSDIVSVGRGQDVKFNHRDLSCFELVTISSGAVGKERPNVFGAKYAHERDSWIQHVIQSIAPSVSMMTECSADIVKAGYTQVRKAVSGSMNTHWMLLSKKKLNLWSTTDFSSLELDLRKISFMQEYKSDPQANMAVTEDEPLFVVHYPELTLYILSKVVFDTVDWFQKLRLTSLDIGRGLNEQPLTHEDVSVIVDKCMKFVSTYGISTRGIYRECGTNSKITRLLDSFCKDAWKVHISSDEYTEHDVANVLKRYLRTLPETLLTNHLYQQWLVAAQVTKDEAIPQYLKLLSHLPRINYMTLKKLIAHLKSVSEQHHLNLMDVSNIASVFGPTLLSTDGDVSLSNTGIEAEVISDIITNYALLFGVSTEEIEKEQKIQKALQELREAKRSQKPAGDILVGIYVHSRQWGKCLNIKLSPTMSALDLCQYVIHQTLIRDRVENLVIYEVVCDAEIERPLHHSEIVLAVALRWASWSDADARDSYLLLKKSEIFHRIAPMVNRQPLSMFAELRFADLKCKSFKKFMFEFKNARLAYYKDAKISQPLGSWNIEDIVWYIGSDTRRQKITEWSLTFIEQRTIIKTGTKETPYFGRTISFSSEEELYRWMAAMLIGQYPNGVLPRKEPMDLLTSD